MNTLTVIVPAFNEQDGLGDTLEAILNQTRAPERIIVANDCSTDATAEVAKAYGVEVVTPPQNLGSKAKAQNFVLPFVDTDLVLPVDADTILSENYIELVIKEFEDPEVVIAAGCVLTRHSNTITERGRSIEYLFGFHLYRPIQNKSNSPAVCSGCCSIFRTSTLQDFGGFPERTIVEDMDFTWTQQIAGKKAIYVSEAVCYAADPEDFKYLKKQVWRWMAGFFQNVRLHMWDLIKHKQMLALWILLAVWEIVTVPLWYAFPFVAIGIFGMSVETTAIWFFGADLGILLPVLLYGCWKRKVPLWHTIASIPALYAVKAVNFYYAWKALIVELILVPLGLSTGLHDYEKGRADTILDTDPPVC